MVTYGEIYIVVNWVNQKVYIGQTVLTLHSRWLSHCGRARRGSSLHFHRAIRKYGEGVFSIYRLNVAYSKEELDSLEVAYIEKFQSFIPEIGYNLTLGGGGVVANEATRQKFRETNTGERNPNFGKRPSEETLKQLSEANHDPLT